MNKKTVVIGIWLVAIFCALTGIASIFYGYLAIYSLSGFTSIFIGAVIIVIASGLIKRHAVARIGAYLILITCSIGCLMWLFFYQHNPNTQISNIGLIEYFCIFYIVLSAIAIIFMSTPSAKKYFMQQ